jgi:trehalose 6-phosphate synthase
VERWDFTKGIVERFQALEALLERNPRHRGRITFLQIASPSRSQLPAYRALQEQTQSEVERINAKFAEGDWRPIVLIGEHQEPRSVFELYRAADFCLVNSLHDGMNLVAKEFVASREDEDGVLILSTFAGASRELTEAVLINPFDVNETAEAMEPHEPHAQDRQGKQRVSLGGTHAHGRGADPPAAKPPFDARALPGGRELSGRRACRIGAASRVSDDWVAGDKVLGGRPLPR